MLRGNLAAKGFVSFDEVVDVGFGVAVVDGGISVGGDGATHQALEEIALMRILPNMTVVVPCDAVEAKKATILSSIGGEAELPKNLVNAAIALQDFDTYLRAIVISDQVAAALSQAGVADEEVSAKVGELLNAKAKTLGVKINPRYGVWDNEVGDVVAANVTGDAVKPSDK